MSKKYSKQSSVTESPASLETAEIEKLNTEAVETVGDDVVESYFANKLAKEVGGEQLRVGTISLVGETNAGKSTLLNALLGEKVSIVSPKPHTTRQRVLGILNRAEGQMVFVDTPGFAKERSASQLAKFVQRELRDGSRGVDLTVLVVDVLPFVRGKRRVEDLVSRFSARGLELPSIVVLNKVDATRKDLLLPLIAGLSSEFQKLTGSVPDLLPVSSVTKDGVEELEKLILSRLPLGPRLFPEDVVSDQSEEFFVSEIVREKLFLVLRQEIPYSLAVHVDHWVDEDTLQKISARIIVERESQKAVVIGKGAQMLKFIGQSAREELEKIFGCKVYLELQVRVEPDWTHSAQGMTRAGYSGSEKRDG